MYPRSSSYQAMPCRADTGWAWWLLCQPSPNVISATPPEVGGIVGGPESPGSPHVRGRVHQPGRVLPDHDAQRHDPEHHAESTHDPSQQPHYGQRDPMPFAQGPVEPVLEQVRGVLSHQLGVAMQRPAEDDPADMGPEASVPGRVRIQVGIRVLVVAAMRSDPVDRAAFQRHRAAGGQKVLQPLGNAVPPVGVQPVIAHADPPADRHPVHHCRSDEVLPREEEQGGNCPDVERRNDREGENVQASLVAEVDGSVLRVAHVAMPSLREVKSAQVPQPIGARSAGRPGSHTVAIGHRLAGPANVIVQ